MAENAWCTLRVGTKSKKAGMTKVHGRSESRMGRRRKGGRRKKEITLA
jgi:hypothetical protein